MGNVTYTHLATKFQLMCQPDGQKVDMGYIVLGELWGPPWGLPGKSWWRERGPAARLPVADTQYAAASGTVHIESLNWFVPNHSTPTPPTQIPGVT